MEQIMKSARLLKAEATEEDLALIARQALRPLAAEEVYTFRLAACNNQVDRDLERFTEATLEDLAKLFVGRPVLLDHKWTAGSQTARVYSAGVEGMPDVEGGQQLVLRCYMPRLQSNGDTIAAIETGLLRECSVGWRWSGPSAPSAAQTGPLPGVSTSRAAATRASSAVSSWMELPTPMRCLCCRSRAAGGGGGQTLWRARWPGRISSGRSARRR